MGALKGETQGRALERVLKDLDEGSRRISLIVNDRHGFPRGLFVCLVAIFTGFAIYRPPNLIVIAECSSRSTSPQSRRRTQCWIRPGDLIIILDPSAIGP